MHPFKSSYLESRHILLASRENPIWAPSFIYTITKREHFIYFIPYDMDTIVVLLGEQAGTYCCQSLGPD